MRAEFGCFAGLSRQTYGASRLSLIRGLLEELARHALGSTNDCAIEAQRQFLTEASDRNNAATWPTRTQCSDMWPMVRADCCMCVPI